MRTSELNVDRLTVRLEADSRRVITRFFVPGGESRVNAITDRVLGLSDEEASASLAGVLGRYSSRHKGIADVFERHYEQVVPLLNGRTPPCRSRRRLIGAYFTSEYSLESVALFNPSIVPHPDQTGLSVGQVRFVMSVRACGEGHVSSIEFRSGVIDTDGAIRLDPVFIPLVFEKRHDSLENFLELRNLNT